VTYENSEKKLEALLNAYVSDTCVDESGDEYDRQFANYQIDVGSAVFAILAIEDMLDMTGIVSDLLLEWLEQPWATRKSMSMIDLTEYVRKFKEDIDFAINESFPISEIHQQDDK
jgi:hypothetical protein